MITGASSGIGAAAARTFTAEGARTVLMARREEKLRDLAAELRAGGGEVALSAGDVTRSEDVERAVSVAVTEFGGLDAAFNNAGEGSLGTRMHEMEQSVYDRIMDVNAGGVWHCMRAQIRAMLDGGRPGSIVNTSSTAGLFATGAAAPYVAAKHAVLGLTKAAAAEYGEQGIRVNALVVGGTRTEMMDEVLRARPELEGPFVARAIQRRLADPEEVARAAAWLCSDGASFVTGGAIPVDGGCSAV
ncbi:SDR family oxidoreductase [Streptomyces sp. HNM0574]|uniref:SDR family NAD(P)-dependent oxidoreductase n=1 Tax=Streptomyces sp. HNM0574 TaxID=2714954 RepID=UPI00146B9651|nr:SDR family oxidoreductase [Streptomyces sp. HNM0574]NLU68703.1 SDR family oxidoreductase [Streptomyces sp. HNM0574]